MSVNNINYEYDSDIIEHEPLCLFMLLKRSHLFLLPGCFITGILFVFY